MHRRVSKEEAFWRPRACALKFEKLYEQIFYGGIISFWINNVNESMVRQIFQVDQISRPSHMYGSLFLAILCAQGTFGVLDLQLAYLKVMKNYDLFYNINPTYIYRATKF